MFLPWVGKEYQKGIQGKRVLILGESHYCADPAEAIPTLTQDIIKDLFDKHSVHEPYKNTYTKFAKALAGTDLDFEDKERIWNMVAFYNYVQTPISGARVSPTPQEFQNSDDAFFETLEQLQPEYVIVWGKRMYDNLPNQGVKGTYLKAKGEDSLETWTYTLNNGNTVKLLGITHPSAGFSWDWWHKMIMTFITS